MQCTQLHINTSTALKSCPLFSQIFFELRHASVLLHIYETISLCVSIEPTPIYLQHLKIYNVNVYV